METWFIFAVISIFVGGAESFTHKITAERGHDFVVLSLFASSLSIITLFTIVMLFAEIGDFSWTTLGVAALAGIIVLLATTLKVEALKSIDTAIFFPIYKVSAPLFTIVLGMIFFQEVFSVYEWIGLILSMIVPLMLVTKAEDKRQKNLKRGLLLLLIGSVATAITTALHKHGVNITPNIWYFMLLVEVFVLSSAVVAINTQHRGQVITKLKKEVTGESLGLSVLLSIWHVSVVGLLLLAFANGGPLAIVYTINSLYILVPIVLSIIFYNEHWNARKIVAIVLSLTALGFLK